MANAVVEETGSAFAGGPCSVGKVRDVLFIRSDSSRCFRLREEMNG